MEKLFESALFTRARMLKVLDQTPYNSLVKIPDNFQNSIFWNIAHVLVTQQLLCYKLTGQELRIDPALVDKYAKGTVPTENVDEADIAYVKTHLVEAMKQTIIDYDKGLFKTFISYPTSTGIDLNSIEEAISFNSFHDGIHLGVVLSLMKLT